MQCLIAFFVVVVAAAGVRAKPSGIAAPLLSPVVSVAVPAPISTQYHAQDETGQYSYGYSNPFSSKAEVRSIDGVTRGAYNYLDAEGKLQLVEYSSDAVNGFRVAASNLPVAPAVPKPPVLVVPEPVKDTPEVIEARARHLDALKEAEVRSAEEPEKTESVLHTVAASPTFSNLALVPGGIYPNLATVRLGAPIVSYNYGFPGAAVTYSTYAAPAFSAYATQIAAPLWTGPQFITPGNSGLAAGNSDAVTVEARAAKAESKEKSD